MWFVSRGVGEVFEVEGSTLHTKKSALAGFLSKRYVCETKKIDSKKEQGPGIQYREVKFIGVSRKAGCGRRQTACCQGLNLFITICSANLRATPFSHE